ncbi:MAG: ankyrin repeat domain-containing protein [Rhodobacteraceae bacterium]|nr:ankyrin repeat domain-containing protein [Paracoccaceae bacterium]
MPGRKGKMAIKSFTNLVVCLLFCLAGTGTQTMAQEQSCSGWLTMSFYANATEANIVRCLREGADIDASSPDGLTPLHYSVREGSPDLVELLVGLGADIDAMDRFGLTPLFRAAQAERFENVDRLVELGADINTRNTWGLTPLHWAAMNGTPEIAKRLILLGSDIQARDDKGYFPYDYLSWNVMIRDNPSTIYELIRTQAARDYVQKVLQEGKETTSEPRKGCVREGYTSFSDLAERHLGGHERWREIYELNNISEGQVIKIGDCFLLPDY